MSIINSRDILETVSMIQDEHLDIRTVTMGISLLDCIDPDIDRACEKVYQKITEKAKNLVPVCEEIEKTYGIPIINKRISVTPIAMVAAACRGQSPLKFALTLEGAIPGTKCMFLLGPQGDVNHFTPFLPNRGRLISEKHKEDPREKALHARYMGHVIAGSVLTVCDRAEEIGNEGIDFAKEEMLLPSNRITEGIEEARKITERHRAGEPYSEDFTYAQVVESYRRIRMFEAPPFMSYHAYALRIGEFAIVGVPGEPFTELGARIYASSPFKHTMTCCMTNAGCGYVPNSASFDEGGYEMNNCNYVRGADDAYVAAAEKALKALK